MKQYSKLITLSVVLLLLITLITLAMIFDVNLVSFNNLSIAGIKEKKMSVENLIQKQAREETNNLTAKETLEKSKNSFDVAKETYENIEESTISIVQEATKEEKYFIEYLWVVLGNYATANGVAINIVTPGASTAKTTEVTDTADKNSSNTTASSSTSSTSNSSTSTSNLNTTGAKGKVQITIEGRYANVADFVFDVENDKSLRFKLDNIKMTYSGNNKVQATFDVLSLSVLQ